MTGHDDFNSSIIDEFRANNGKVGGMFAGANMVLVHHTGAKTGAARVTPLVYQPVNGSYAVFASAAGSPNDPQWFRNLVANPNTSIEVGDKTIPVTARVAAPEEREPIWTRQKEQAPGFGDYEKSAAPRVIPVVLLDPVS